jgi:hypothetical protein
MSVKEDIGWSTRTNKSPSPFHSSFFLNLGEHLLVFPLNELVVDVASCMETGERLQGILVSAFDHEPPGQSAADL